MTSATDTHAPKALLGFIAAALACAALAVVLAGRHIYLHLRGYTRPDFQLHIVRILAMAPIYSVTAFLALVVSAPRALLWLAIVRDCYEAYVIYNFVVLLINYGGGDRQLIYFLEGQPRLKHAWPMSRFLPPMRLGASFINAVRAAVLQFIFVKPAAAFAKLKLFELANTSGSRFTALHILLAIVENLSISLALYGLVIFYHATEEVLRPNAPLPKFLSVKAVVFFSFWQGVVLSVAVSLGLITDIEGVTAHEQATGIQDVLICAEMLIASIVHYHVFSHTEFTPDSNQSYLPIRETRHPLLRNFGDIVDIRDVLSDAKARLEGGTTFESELRDEEPLLPGADRVLGSLSRNSNASTSSITYDLSSAPWNLSSPSSSAAAAMAHAASPLSPNLQSGYGDSRRSSSLRDSDEMRELMDGMPSPRRRPLRPAVPPLDPPLSPR